MASIAINELNELKMEEERKRNEHIEAKLPYLKLMMRLMPYYLSKNKRIKEYTIEFGELLSYIINAKSNPILKFLEEGLLHVLAAYTPELFNLLNGKIVNQEDFDYYEPRHEFLAGITQMVKVIITTNDTEKMNDVNDSLKSVYATDLNNIVKTEADFPSI